MTLLIIKQIINLLNIITGNKLVIEKWYNCGIKETYHVDTNELIILIKAGAEIIVINQYTNDGTYLHKVKFLDLYFMQSTLDTISI